MQLGLILITLLEDQDRTQIKTLTAVSCGGFSFFTIIITIIESRLQMGGRWPKPWAKKKRAQMLSLLKLNL